jgi:hypothetical protein
MSTFIVSFASSRPKGAIDEPGRYMIHLTRECQKLRSAGIEMHVPAIVEFWTNAEQTHYILVHSGGTPQMSASYRTGSMHGSYMACVPENFKTSGVYSLMEYK